MKFKVLSYNIHKGFDGLGLKFVLHEIKRALQETEVDLLLLQEVVGENKSHQKNIDAWPHVSQFEFLADTLWPHYSYGKNAVFSEKHHGNAILSRYPILFEENIDISTNRWESRGLLHCAIQIPPLGNQELHVFNVHLDLREKGRKLQLEKIIERAKMHVPADTPFIVGGDFNDWAQSASPLLTQHLGLYESHFHIHQKYATSFPSFKPVMKLDRMYVRDVKVLQSITLTKTPWPQLSDHLPLYTEFEISPEDFGGQSAE